MILWRAYFNSTDDYTYSVDVTIGVFSSEEAAYVAVAEAFELDAKQKSENPSNWWNRKDLPDTIEEVRYMSFELDSLWD